MGVEQTLDKLREDVSATRVLVAELSGRFVSIERLIEKVEHLERSANDHVSDDAEQHGRFGAELHRLWWGVGAVMTAVFATLVSSIAKAMS